MSLFKNRAEKREKEQQQVLNHMGKICHVLETLENKGLISYDPLQRRLFIASVVANIYLQSEKAWGAFLGNVYSWALLKRQREAWDAYFRDVELKAVREAKQKYASLSKNEIRQIRNEARMAVEMDKVKPPKVFDFEFFITDLTKPEEPVIAIGQYDGTKFSMARYEDVKRFINKK